MKSNARRFRSIIGIIGLGLIMPLNVALADSQSFKQLSAEWQQWALSIPPSINPQLDKQLLGSLRRKNFVPIRG
jgi:hypothetical protein